ncbi:hypothetical protein [Mycobacterium tuberculosis]|uniref:hypothetical protein n=1 Tax=Mycobacterium tuberculosis TaxID=1773 RepID=UPI00272B4C28|nr:hypothetical protein [Mycobacterium tuberculosis]
MIDQAAEHLHCKRNLRKFLARAPGDWIFESFSEQLVCHRVRQYLSEALPTCQ